LSEADQLHKALDSEDNNEDSVDTGQIELKLRRLTIVLHGHRYHIEQDDDHYKYIKLLVSDHREEKLLNFEL